MLYILGGIETEDKRVTAWCRVKLDNCIDELERILSSYLRIPESGWHRNRLGKYPIHIRIVKK